MAKKKGGSKTLLIVAVLLGLLTATCCCLGMGGVGSVFYLVRESEPYKLAAAEVAASSKVRSRLGEPVEAGWWVTGNVSLEGSGGSANLTFPVSGPRGDAEVYAESERRAGVWHPTSLIVEIEETGERLALR